MSDPAHPFGFRTPVLILVCGTLILLLSLGARQTYGLLMAPVSADLGWGREIFSFAVAVQALVWGFAAPPLGALADRYGPGRVVAVSGLIYVVGLYMMSEARDPIDAHLSIGFLTGVGMAGTMFPIIMSVVARVTPANRRSLYLGIASAGGSSGMFFTVPAVQLAIDSWGWAAAILLIAGAVALIVPLAYAIAIGPPGKGGAPEAGGVGPAVREAGAHRGFLLLTAGYFVCGFQTMFVGAHLPAMLQDFSVSPRMGAVALTLIGLFNVIGCFVWGVAGGRWPAKYLLCALYLSRSLVMMVFFVVPITNTSVIVFAVVVGLLWLGTVPLTGTIVAQIFGPSYVATIYGMVYLNHQIGAFLGIWLGGVLYDSTGSYALVWWISVALGGVAALLHYPIDDRPIAREAAARS